MRQTLGSLLLLGLLVVGWSASAPSAQARYVPPTPGQVTTSLWVRPHTDPSSRPVIGAPTDDPSSPYSTVDVFCWRDGKVASVNGHRSQRWFLIQFVKSEGYKPIGFISVLAFANQPRVPRCVYNRVWPQQWAPAADADVPSMIIGRQVWPPGYLPENPPSGQSDGPAAPQTPAEPAYAETVGGLAHTWTNASNAGGNEGPSIAAYNTVQIGCKLSGFRVADGNTWWYRIASSPWNGSYYVSADAFYNNGQTSGSLIGTPFVDPAVRDC